VRRALFALSCSSRGGAAYADAIIVMIAANADRDGVLTVPVAAMRHSRGGDQRG
jgi:hypothetical protein